VEVVPTRDVLLAPLAVSAGSHYPGSVALLALATGSYRIPQEKGKSTRQRHSRYQQRRKQRSANASKEKRPRWKARGRQENSAENRVKPCLLQNAHRISPLTFKGPTLQINGWKHKRPDPNPTESDGHVCIDSVDSSCLNSVV